MYITRWDDNLHLNVNFKMTKDDISKIRNIFKEAASFIY